MANLTLTKMFFPTNVINGTGPLNLATPDPKEVATHTASVNFDMDFGASMSFDSFFVGFLSSAPTDVIISSATGLGTGLSSLGSASLGPTTALRRHAFLKVGSPVNSRYWRVGITSASALTVGISAFGLAVQPTYGHEWGSGRQPLDSGIATGLRGGGFAVEPAAKKALWQFTTSDLTDTDLKALWDMALDLGTSSPVLAVEDPALAQPDLNSALHYGLLQRPEAYERQLGGHRWAWRVEEWV